MSLERAYKNCMICYSTGKSNYPDNRAGASMVPMNEAMKALEEERVYSTRHATGERTRRYKIAEDALQACVGCEFKCASIVEFLKKALPDQFNLEGLV